MQTPEISREKKSKKSSSFQHISELKKKSPQPALVKRRQKIVCFKKGEYSEKASRYDSDANSIPVGKRSCECLRPCKKSFLSSNSSGTLTHKEKLGEQTKFQGCQKLEDYLVANGFVSYDLRERVGHLTMFDHDDREDNFVYENESRAERMLDLTVDAYFNLLFEREIALANSENPDYLGPESHPIKPKERKSSSRFHDLMLDLTEAQREVVIEYYINNTYRRSAKEISKKIGISYHAFRDRLKGAMKKIHKNYPEKKRKQVLGLNKKELLFSGFWRQSEANKKYPVRYQNFVTGANEIVDTTKANPFKIAELNKQPLCLRWLDQDHSEIYRPENSFNMWQELYSGNISDPDSLFDRRVD